MNYEFYQMKPNTMSDGKYMRFEGSIYMEKYGYRPKAEDYIKVYAGTAQKSGHMLEALFQAFNTNPPQDYRGRSMAVSDVVVLEDNDGKRTAWMCDNYDFADVSRSFFGGGGQDG